MRPQIKQYTASNEVGVTKLTGMSYIFDSMKRCTRRPFQKLIPHEGIDYLVSVPAGGPSVGATCYGRLPLIIAFLRVSKSSVFNVDLNYDFVYLLHHLHWLQPVLRLF